MRARRDLGLLVAAALAGLIASSAVAALVSRARLGELRVQAYHTTDIPEARLYWLGVVSALVLLAGACHIIARRRLARHLGELAVLDAIGVPQRSMTRALVRPVLAAAVSGAVLGAVGVLLGGPSLEAIDWPLAAAAAVVASLMAGLGAWAGSAPLARWLERTHGRHR